MSTIRGRIPFRAPLALYAKIFKEVGDPQNFSVVVELEKPDGTKAAILTTDGSFSPSQSWTLEKVLDASFDCAGRHQVALISEAKPQAEVTIQVQAEKDPTPS